MKYLCILLVLLVGCNQSTGFPLKTKLTAEGFIACSSAFMTMQHEEVKRIEDAQIKAKAMAQIEADLKAEQEKQAKLEEAKRLQEEQEALIKAEENKVKVPSKYLRLFSAEAGCGPCIHQEQILMGSSWIMKYGTEEQNQEDLKYHILKETIPFVKGYENAPQWDKYQAKLVPFWQLIENGKVVKTRNGVMSLQQIYDFYTKMDLKGQHNNDKCTCENCKCGSECMCGQ